MPRSEQIKLEIERLTSEARKKKQSLDEQRMLAATQYEHVKQAISQFAQQEKSEIARNRNEKLQNSQAAFAKKYGELRATIEGSAGHTYEAWDAPLWSSFSIQNERPAHNLTRLGTFTVKAGKHSLLMPALFSVLGGRNLLLRAKGTGRHKARRVLRNTAFRLLASQPPGKLRFTFIDPVDLGSTAAGLVGVLPDFLTGGLAWHEEQDIQDQLSLIETRIAAIKTKYLGIKFPSIEQYNAHAGTIEEPYWLVVISDCPVRFRDDSLQKLLTIAKNGPQTGVYLAIMLDEAQKRCTDSLLAELAETANQIVCPDHDAPVFFEDPDFRDSNLHLDPPPSPELAEMITEQVHKTAASAQNVRINWEAPSQENWWKEDSRHGLKIPLGTYGARQTQSFEIDEKLLNSALIIGKPGSGKSRLLHVLINGLTTRYSPHELALYLLDCKQVEFKDYAVHQLPHARVVAIESEREFGLSVLHRLNAELDCRKTEFSSVGETSLSSYRKKSGKSMPRIVLIIDEFHELLNADDALAREAAAILDRLVRLGRALGINVVLASQTLAGQTTLLSSTKNQIPIRIVLQCSESDSISALGQDNDEARLLERPGEAIYNSTNGRREGNNRFQVSWLSDEALESLLSSIKTRAADLEFVAFKPPVIFDGNSLADINQNRAFNRLLQTPLSSNTKGKTFAWLGEPIEMKESTAAIFKRQSRSNLLVLGQNEYEQACASMLLTSIVSIAFQHPPDATRFLILNLGDPDADWSRLPSVCKASFPHQIELITKAKISEELNALASLVEQRAAETAAIGHASIYIFIFGLHRERSLRHAGLDSGSSKLGLGSGAKPLSSAELLSRICRDGPMYGIHSSIWCDTFSNFGRVFPRGGIEEFGLRVAMQMSESDSRSLIDSDAASRLGGHRAVFFDDEKHGRLEKFRPYSLVSASWIESVACQLNR